MPPLTSNKDATIRMNETLDFINTMTLVTLAERQIVFKLVNDFVNSKYPPNNAGSAAYENFSKGMALGWHLQSDPDERRKMCRAIYLIAHAMHDKDSDFALPFQKATDIIQSTADATLVHLVRKARIIAERHKAMALGYVLNQVFRTNPLAFLQHNKIIVYGVATNDENQGDENILDFTFSYKPTQDRYELWPTHQAEGYHLQAESVFAVHWSRIPNQDVNNHTFTGIQGIKLSGQHMMVTTKLTGCSFCMQQVGDSVYCAHIAPQVVNYGLPLMSGDELAKELLRPVNQGGGDFANAHGNKGGFRVYGRGAGNGNFSKGYNVGSAGGSKNYTSIVGFPNGNSYDIYSQVTIDDKIAGVYKIFP